MTSQTSTAKKGYRTRKPHGGLRRFLRIVAWRNPKLNQALIGKRADLMALDEDLSVDGFPRCASTFVVEAVRHLHGESEGAITVDGQTHNPGHILHALQQKQPLLICIRQPKDCCISWAIHQDAPLVETLRFFIDFHRALEPRLEEMLITDFDFTISRLESVFAALNARFDLQLRVDFTSEDIRKSVFERMEDRDRRVSHTQVMFATPQEARDELKQKLRASLTNDPKLQRLERQAQGIYERFRKEALN